jgi:predicted phosphoribosyltransferase
MSPARFGDRREAGRLLAARLGTYAGRPDVVVLALPRGGVPVAYEVARALHAPLDVFLVRKLGVPGHEELALGAIASGGTRVLNEDVVREVGIRPESIDRIAGLEQQELERRERAYRSGRPALPLQNQVVLLVDDGLATGASMRAAARAVRARQPARVVVAVPTAAAETCADLQADADEVVAVMTPSPFRAVGLWYDDFSQTTDAEVKELLELARRAMPPA